MRYKQLGNPLLLLTVGLAVLYVTIFLIPGQLRALAFLPDLFYTGEWWRLFTFPFSHISVLHLTQNVAGVVLVGFLMTELKFSTSDFSFVYFPSGNLAVLPLLTAVGFSAAGASAAIFGALGAAVLKAQNFASMRMISVLIILAVFAQSMVSLLSCGQCAELGLYVQQAASHLSGLVFGIALFSLLMKTRTKLAQKKYLMLRSFSEV